MADVVVLGSLNIDLVATVERLPTPGETLTARHFARRPGGKGANQAAAAARAGATTRLIGCVGSGDGQSYRELLHARGVDISSVRFVPDIATGHALIVVDDFGENTIVVAPGANAEVGEHEIGALDLRAGDVLVLQQEIPAEAVRAAARAGRDAGSTVLLNPSPWRGQDAQLFGDCDTLIVNAGEAEQLRTAGYDVSQAVVTSGGEGARWGDLRAPGQAVTAVDTTGAGDAFTGTLAAAIAAGADRRTALEQAVRAGSQAVLHEGAQPWSF